jgi:hypothetical protein
MHGGPFRYVLQGHSVSNAPILPPDRAVVQYESSPMEH